MTDHGIRAGSLQFYPRIRANKILPRVNWETIKKNDTGLKGFLGYKVGMTSVYVRDNTTDSMTKSKKIIVPATIVECPVIKIYAVRFYKEKKAVKDVVVGFDDELKRKIKKPKQLAKLDDFKGDFDDVKIIVYTDVKKTSIKKTPDIAEIGLSGTKEEKLNFIKEKIGKEINASDVFSKEQILVDIRAVTKGYGTQGPVKRFGISLKQHKTEKGVRRPGSLGPWHPARVTFRVPMAGQTGFHSRVSYNNLILKVGKISEKDINKQEGFHRYGKIKTNYILLRGSIPGPKKRPILMTYSFRPTKKVSKLKYEFIELR